ncbi:hypothetical protein G4B88_031011 [Cannabis sativa]|uniref:Uncharacterized protein n=1 Tax=Cannabis sativa TaxID=3483 RepID=A0A7J6FVU9_CANSA|nr:hypothetical protein G4B88_031011 [Cannabis sativa]
MTMATSQQLRYVQGSSFLTTTIDRGSRLRKIGRWVCNCEPPQEVAVGTSKTVKNPGRMFKCCHKFKPQRSPSCNYGDHHGGCPSIIFRSPCSSHHKDDSFGDENETTSMIKEKKSNCVLWFFGVLIVIFVFKMLF